MCFVKNEESMDHLLHFNLTKEVWGEVLTITNDKGKWEESPSLVVSKIDVSI